MAPSTSKEHINFVLFAHPDDEYASWSLIHSSPESYPVFCMLTRGEQTAYCPNPYYDPGEDQHSVLPAPKGSTDCKTARINSHRNFLERMAEVDPYIEDPPYVGERTGISDHGTISDRDYALYAGSKVALLIFNLGDGDLEQNEVEWACMSAQEAKADGDLPDLPENAVIGACYHNAVDYGKQDGCRYYDHPDHHAVHLAVWNTNFGVSGHQWAATAHCDPEVGRTDEIPRSIHDHAFERNPNERKIGVYQRAYGWMHAEYWDYHHHVNKKLEQRHWQRF